MTSPSGEPAPWAARGTKLLRAWGVPALLATAQAGLWSAPHLSGVPRTGAVPVGAVVALLGSVLALGVRRRAPERALVGTLLASAAAHLWQAHLHADLVEVECVLVALYSCAVRLEPRRSATVCAAAVAVLAGLQPTLPGRDTDLAQPLLVVALCAVAVGAGFTRRHWRGERLRNGQQMRLAVAEERQAATAERDRLARELHDVTAHHLTSVVVTADVARRLGERKPDLVAEAIEFSARTGQETITALRRLVTLLGTGQEPDSGLTTADLEQLVAGFSKLGRPIAVRLAPDLAGRAATAAHGIVREALTNALRYAPGAPVSVRVERVDSALRVSVKNGAPRHAGAAASLGSGRGLAGMRQRAEAVGGTVSAGPNDDGGWTVRAVLPDSSGPLTPPDARRRNFPAEQRAADVAVAGSLVCAALAAVLLLAPGSATAWPTGALFALQALALLWRRHAPWAVLVTTLVTTAPWPVLAHLGLTTAPSWVPLVCGTLIGSAAVYAVAAYGRPLTGSATSAARATVAPRPPRIARSLPTWSAVALATIVHATVVTTTGLTDGRIQGVSAGTGIVLGTFLLTAVVLTSVLGVAWASGWAMHRYRLGVALREDGVVQASMWQKEVAAQGERARMATGLEVTVLHHTGSMVRHAEGGRLEEVAEEARKALASMRLLLEGLRTPASAELMPQRTAADLQALCRERRARGRPVVLHCAPGATDGLPGDVDLAAFHAVESSLRFAGRAPVHVTVWRELGMLRVALAGMGMGAYKAVRRARPYCVAVRGGVLAAPDGIVHVWLPLGEARRRSGEPLD